MTRIQAGREGGREGGREDEAEKALPPTMT
jgi:hypothetical protein